MRKQWSWVQPTEQRGTGTTPKVDVDAILESVSAIPELSVTSCKDVDRLYVRPGKGMVKVRLKSNWEVQVDLGTSRVL